MRSGLARFARYSLGVTIIVLSSASYLMAGQAAAAPEIDGTSISTGLGLLTSGLLILRARRSK